MTDFEKAVEYIRKNVINGFKKLLDKNPEILKEKDQSEWNLLHHAIYVSNIDIARLLIDYGTDVNSRDSNDLTPLYYAVLDSSRELIELLLEHAAIADTIILQLAIYRNSIETVRILLKHGADINSVSNTGDSVLHIATRRGYLDIVKLLLDYNADLNVKDSYGWTPLHYAADQDRIDIVKLFILKGIDPYIQDSEGRSAIELIEDEKTKNELLFLYKNREKILEEMNRQKDRGVDCDKYRF